MMRTNKAKFDYYKGILTARSKIFMEQYRERFPNEIMEVNALGEIVRYFKKKQWYGYRTQYNMQMDYYGEKPTRQEVERIAKLCDQHIDFKPEYIVTIYETNVKGSCTTIAVKFHDISKYHFEESEAIKERDKLIREKEEREYLLANGHIACSYCGKIVKEIDAVKEKIINIKMYGKGGKYFLYCSGKCAGNDQMAHEG